MNDQTRAEKEPLISTFRQARRLVRIVIGFTIVILGCVMLLLPGPGLVTIVLGLAVLGTEFVWAKKLMSRFEKEANNMKNNYWNSWKRKRK